MSLALIRVSPRMAMVLVVGLSAAVLTLDDAAAQESPRYVELSLAEAETSALAGNPTLRAAGARNAGAQQRARAAAAYLWPSLEASVGVVRTDDPVGVFGSKLRQRRFGEADLALPALNDPSPVSDYTAGLGAVWSVGDRAKSAQRSVRRHEAEASAAMWTHTAEAVVLEVRIFYLQAVAAREATSALEAEVAAARETAQRVSLRVEEGMATEADRLQASAAVADATARLRLAEAAQADALGRLGVQLGWGPDSIPQPAPGLPDVVDRSEDAALEARRADLQASAASAEAARARAGAAAAARLPVVEAFGQVGVHDSRLFADRAANWTLGMSLRVPVFTGFALSATRRAAQAEAEAAAEGHRQRVLQAEAETGAVRRGVTAARESRDAARAARDASTEAARLLGLRFGEGMATLSDLLNAQSRAAGLDARLIEAEAHWRMQLARLDFVLGTTATDETNQESRR